MTNASRRSPHRVLVPLAAVLLLTSIAFADNVAPNGGFEMADGDLCAFWEKRTPDDASRTLEWVAEGAHTGTHCVKTTNREKAKSRWRTGHLCGLVLKPGSALKLSAWIKTQGEGCSGYLAFYSMSAEGKILGQPTSSRVTGNSDWKQVTLEGAIPAGAAYSMIYLETEGVGTAWFDDVTLDATPGERTVGMKMKRIVYGADNLDLLDGLQVVDWTRKRYLQMAKGAKTGRAQRLFFGPSAKYDIGFDCIDEFRGASTVTVLVNGREAGTVRLDQPKGKSKGSYEAGQKTLPGVNIQRYSTITLEITPDRGERCRIQKMELIPSGRFDGEFAKLARPPSLRIYEAIQDQHKGRGMLNAYLHRRMKPVQEKREAELAALKTPGDWKARQQRTRARLHEFFGEWPARTPLNAKTVGKLDREKYTIEKVIFESQPNYYCTANLYIPKGRKLPAPGILFTCGHAADGKGAKLYHESCLGLVLKGYVALGLDPTGQGERSEYFDPETLKPLVSLTVSQHHYMGRPAWLVDWSLSGSRTWDCVRAVDYLCSCPEVDKDKLGVSGNSGGGQMALLITAADERIKVCAAAHPGGSMENSYLLGQGIVDREVMSLIAPRPCRWIVGKDSGEEPGHRRRMEDMQRFYEGLGVDKNLTEMDIVHGVHNMKQPKRESAYEWLNRFFHKEQEGKAEPPLQPEEVKTLWCTESGCTLKSLGGESGQTINAKRAERMYKPEPDTAKLRARVAKRIGLTMPEARDVPTCRAVGTFEADGFTAEKIAFVSEEGIEVPALLMKPKKPDAAKPLVIHASDKGKPTRPDAPCTALALVREGYTVLSIDVRGVGETDRSPPVKLTKYTGYTPLQWRRDCMAIWCPGFGTTMLALRSFDVVRAIDFAKSRDDLKDRKVVLVGEGLGGLWASIAAAYDGRPQGVVTVGTLGSYKLALNSHYYDVWNYFWLPGALRDFDIPDLARLAAPKKQLWIDPVDALAERLDEQKAGEVIGQPDGLRVVRTANGSPEEAAKAVGALLR